MLKTSFTSHREYLFGLLFSGKKKGASCFDECFLLHVITGRYIYFIKVYRCSRSSHPEVFCKKKCSQKFRRPWPATLSKKETLALAFSCELCEISKNFFYRTPLVAASAALKFFNSHVVAFFDASVLEKGSYCKTVTVQCLSKSSKIKL